MLDPVQMGMGLWNTAVLLTPCMIAYCLCVYSAALCPSPEKDESFCFLIDVFFPTWIDSYLRLLCIGISWMARTS